MATLIQRQWFYHSSSKARIHLISLLRKDISFNEFTVLIMDPKIKSKASNLFYYLDKSLNLTIKEQRFYNKMSKALLSTFLIAFHISDPSIQPQAILFIDKFHNSPINEDLHRSWIKFYKILSQWQLQDKQQMTVQIKDELSKLDAFKKTINDASNEWNSEITKVESQLSNYLNLIDNPSPQSTETIDSIQFLHDLFLDGDDGNWHQRLSGNYSSLQSFDSLIQNFLNLYPNDETVINNERELALVLLSIIKEQLLALVKKDGHYHSIITESIGLESIKIRGLNPLDYEILNLVLDIMKQLCSPARDDIIKNIQERIKAIKKQREKEKKEKEEKNNSNLNADTSTLTNSSNDSLIKITLDILKTIHIMHQDHVHYCIKVIGSSLPLTIVQKERTKFAEIMKGKELINLKTQFQKQIQDGNQRQDQSSSTIEATIEATIPSIKNISLDSDPKFDLKSEFVKMIIRYLNINNKQDNKEESFESNELFLWDKSRFNKYRQEIKSILNDSRRILLNVNNQSQDLVYNLLNQRLLDYLANSLLLGLGEEKEQKNIDKMGFPPSILDRIVKLQTDLMKWKCHHLNVFAPIYNNLFSSFSFASSDSGSNANANSMFIPSTTNSASISTTSTTTSNTIIITKENE